MLLVLQIKTQNHQTWSVESLNHATQMTDFDQTWSKYPMVHHYSVESLNLATYRMFRDKGQRFRVKGQMS